MTARTPRTTREEREGLWEAARGCEAYWPAPWRYDQETVLDTVGVSLALVTRPEVGPHLAAANPRIVVNLLDDLRDAEAERDAAVERAERAEAAVGRVREVAAATRSKATEFVHVAAKASIPERQALDEAGYALDAVWGDILAAVATVPWPTAALDPATDAETGRGGAGRGSAEQPVHQCPPNGSGVMPCCGRTPFEVARGDRMSSDPALVTCAETDDHEGDN